MSVHTVCAARILLPDENIIFLAAITFLFGKVRHFKSLPKFLWLFLIRLLPYFCYNHLITRQVSGKILRLYALNRNIELRLQLVSVEEIF